MRDPNHDCPNPARTSLAARLDVKRLRCPALLLRLPDRFGQCFEQRGDALWSSERGGDLLVHDDGFERTSSLLEVLAARAAGQIVTTEIGFALTGHFRKLSAGPATPFGR